MWVRNSMYQYLYVVVFSCSRERSVNVSEPESLELTVSNLKPERSYSFRIIAYNDVGPGESSPPLRITTKPDRKTLGKSLIMYILWYTCLLAWIQDHLLSYSCFRKVFPSRPEDSNNFWLLSILAASCFQKLRRLFQHGPSLNNSVIDSWAFLQISILYSCSVLSGLTPSAKIHLLIKSYFSLCKTTAVNPPSLQQLIEAPVWYWPV